MLRPRIEPFAGTRVEPLEGKYNGGFETRILRRGVGNGRFMDDCAGKDPE